MCFLWIVEITTPPIPPDMVFQFLGVTSGHSIYFITILLPSNDSTEDMFSKVRECIRRLNPGVKGRRCRFRRGGTNISSKTVKGTHIDRRPVFLRRSFDYSCLLNRITIREKITFDRSRKRERKKTKKAFLVDGETVKRAKFSLLNLPVCIFMEI
jgi:hypothetical protein